MNTRQHPKNTTAMNSPKTRWTIGFLTAHFADFRFYGTWTGIADVVRERGGNLICFPVQDIASESAMSGNMAAVLRDRINPAIIDGLITHQWWSSQQWFERIASSYHPLPIVTIFRQYKGYPGVIADNYQGMREALRHLIEDHGYRRISYIRGPEGTSADERYRAYTDTLEQYQIPFDATVVIPGDHTDAFGQTAIRLLLDDRKLRPGIDIEAIVSSNDSMVIGMLEELQRRKIQIPYEMAVVGFDGEIWTSFSSPPLTTTSVPWYELGRRAAEELFALLEGQEVPESIIVPTQLVIRRSCGCVARNIRQAAVGKIGQADTTIETIFAGQRESLLAALREVGGSALTTFPDWAERLFDAFVADVTTDTPNVPASSTFLPTLEDVLFQVEQCGHDVEIGHEIVSELRRQLLPSLDPQQTLLKRAEDLWQQSRVMVSNLVREARMRRQAKADQQTAFIRELGQRLISTFDVMTLMDTLVTGLPSLGFPGVYLAIYEDPQKSINWARLILGYNEQGRIELEQEGRRFSTSVLLPEDLLLRENPYSIVVEPLYFGNDHLGIIFFEMGSQDGKLYDILRGEISSALQGALLVERVQEHAYELATAYEEIQILNNQLKEENLRMSAELDVSRRIQQMLLPRLEELQQIEGVDIVGYMQPADEVGGDYYDVFKEHGVIHIGIGDVTGHGLESGLLMLMTQTAIRTLIEHGETDPIKFVTTLNRTIYKNAHRMGADKTLTFALVNYRDGQLKIVGQHEELLVVRAGGHVERVDTINLGFPIGLEKEITQWVASAALTLEPGDGIVLYTDGITEAENPNHEMYGLDRLCVIISQHWEGRSAADVKQAVVNDVMQSRPCMMI